MSLSRKDHSERLRSLEVSLAGIAQRVADHEQDFHRFGPLVTEQALLRQTAERINTDLHEAHTQIRAIADELEKETQARITAEATRKEELELALKARDKEMAIAEAARNTQHRELQNRIRVATLALIGVFITSGMSVLAAIVAGSQ